MSSAAKKKVVALRWDRDRWDVLVRPIELMVMPADYIFVSCLADLPVEDRDRLKQCFSMVPVFGEAANRRLMDLEELPDFLMLTPVYP